jgi:hypothetical protein
MAGQTQVGCMRRRKGVKPAEPPSARADTHAKSTGVPFTPPRQVMQSPAQCVQSKRQATGHAQDPATRQPAQQAPSPTAPASKDPTDAAPTTEQPHSAAPHHPYANSIASLWKVHSLTMQYETPKPTPSAPADPQASPDATSHDSDAATSPPPNQQEHRCSNTHEADHP